jgi:hypothetical protein
LRRFVSSLISVLLLAMALHESAHRLGEASYGMGAPDPPCPVCAQIRTGSRPDPNGTQVSSPARTPEPLPPVQSVPPSDPRLSPAPVRGPPLP